MGTEHEARGGELFPTLAERGEAKFTAVHVALRHLINIHTDTGCVA